MDIPLIHYGWEIELLFYEPDNNYARVIDHEGNAKRFWAQPLHQLGLQPGDRFDFGVYAKQFMTHVRKPAAKRAAKWLLNELIKVRAYLKWEKEGYQHGNDRRHWLEAEEEIMKIAQAFINKTDGWDRTYLVNAFLGDSLCDERGIKAVSNMFDEVEKTIIEHYNDDIKTPPQFLRAVRKTK